MNNFTIAIRNIFDYLRPKKKKSWEKREVEVKAILLFLADMHAL